MKFLYPYLLIGLLVACSKKVEEKTTNEDNSDKMILNDPHSYAKPEESVVKHLAWVASVDFEKKVISAVATLTIENNAVASSLFLDTKALNIESVSLDNGKIQANYEIGESDLHLGESLQIDIEPTTKNVVIRYSTSENAEALQWLSPMQTADKEHPFLFTQSQAILARSWVPIQDSPGIRFTYNAQVTVPKELMALMSAENPKEKSEDGVYNFAMKQPIPAYLLALAVGDLEFEELSSRTGVYAEPSVIKKATYEFAELEPMVAAAEELYGPYQWEQYDLIVLPPSFPFGGMENPRLTFATPTILAGDRSLTSLVAHELAHSWSGNLVTNATWNDFWLNEGFTVYFENRIMEKLYGRDYSEMLTSLAAQDLREEIKSMIDDGVAADTKLKLSLEGRNPDDGVTSIAYDKGYLFLRSLEEEVGREKFDIFLREYFTSNAFEVMTTEEFIEELETKLFEKNGLEMNRDKINSWIYTEGLPENAPSPASNKFDLVDKEWERYAEGSKLNQLATANWSSHEWLHFVRSIPETAGVAEMKKLDDEFNFTKSGNSEVLTEWLVQSIRHNFEAAYDRLEDFLVNTGRRKFLMPLYKELIKSEEGLKRARVIYKKARPNYHFVSTNSIDPLLDQK